MSNIQPNIQLSSVVHESQSSSLYQRNYEEFLAKSRNNEMPHSSFERSQLSFLIKRTRIDLQECDDIGCNWLMKTLEFQQSLLSPIRTLPAEIIGEIFYFVVKPPSIRFTDYSENTRKLTGPIFTLSWVCFRWRNQALSQRALWSSLRLDLRNFHDTDIEVAEFLKDCILRSGRHATLSLDLVMGITRSRRLPLPSLHTVIAALVEQARRWESLRIFVFRGSRKGGIGLLNNFHDMLLSKRTSDSLPTSFPLLKYLRIVYRGNSPQILALDMFSMTRETFLHCPSLHALEMSSLWGHEQIDFNNLIHLQISDCYFGSSIAILLERCPNLQSFTINQWQSEFEEDSPAPQISHTSLTHLYLLRQHYKSKSGVWKSVYLPNLTYVSVKVESHGATSILNSPSIFDELKEMLERSKCILQGASVNGEVDDDVIAKLLRSIHVAGQSSQFPNDH